MKLLFSAYILFLFTSSVCSQSIQVINQATPKDSSFYHLEKINNNEFWAGGEYGILKKIDSTGIMHHINYPNDGLAILNIERIGDYVFILTEDAVIYRYDLNKDIFIKKVFPSFKNKCFYDLVGLENGDLVVCGGAKDISKAQRKIPKGFIAVIDQDLKEIKVIWKKKRKFVWALLKTKNQEVLAATYNGLNTKIIKSNDLKSWKKEFRIKGLVHELSHIENQIWYSGSKNNRFRKHGIIGQAAKGQDRQVLKNTGCLWSIDSLDEKVIAVTQQGKLFILDKSNKTFEQLKIPKAYSLYDFELISESKILIVGQGKAAYLIHLQQ